MDLRVKRTRKMLREALWEGIMERGFDQLTVSEVCERAMINRATFYRHYEDMNDLLLRGLDEFFDEIHALAEPAPSPDDAETYTFHGPPRNFLLLIEFLNDRVEFFRLMFSERGISAFVARMRLYLEDMIRARIEVSRVEGRASLIPEEIVVRSWAGQMMGLLIWWIEEGCDRPVEDAALYFMSSMIHNIFELLGRDLPAIGFDFPAELAAANRRHERLRGGRGGAS